MERNAGFSVAEMEDGDLGNRREREKERERESNQ